MSYLQAFGHHLPTRTVTNADLEQRTGRTAASIEKASGILERRYAAQNETVAGLGLAAANACLKNANLTANDIGLILFSSGSAERTFPGPASAASSASQCGSCCRSAPTAMPRCTAGRAPNSSNQRVKCLNSAMSWPCTFQPMVQG